MEYKYYLLGDTVPIRVTFNDEGQKIGAEIPKRENGQLVKAATYLSKIDTSLEIEEISETDFNSHVERVLGRGG